MFPAPSHVGVVLRTGVGLAAVGVLCLTLAGCQPEPSTSAAPSATPAASATPEATPTPTQTSPSAEDIALPTACEQLTSPAMSAALQAMGPLNDPGVTMTSTQNVDALEILTSGVPTIRCSWGVPSESGMATNVTIVDAGQAASVEAVLAGAGFGCGAELGGTVCRSAQSMITQDDELAELTETHVLRGNAWVSTYAINFEVPGYTEDIVATLWG